jgi:hypothetical protein
MRDVLKSPSAKSTQLKDNQSPLDGIAHPSHLRAVSKDEESGRRRARDGGVISQSRHNESWHQEAEQEPDSVMHVFKSVGLQIELENWINHPVPGCIGPKVYRRKGGKSLAERAASNVPTQQIPIVQEVEVSDCSKTNDRTEHLTAPGHGSPSPQQGFDDYENHRQHQ